MSPGAYKNDVTNSTIKHIVFDKNTLRTFRKNVSSPPPYHGEDVFELMHSKK